MEQQNGRLEVLDNRHLPTSLRQRSKVPRARIPQRTPFMESHGNDFQNGAITKNYPSRSNYNQGMSATFTCHQLDGTDEYKEWQRVVGERVCISGVKQGILRYFGRTNFANGYWCGVELDEAVGKNNGTVNGIVYFNCKPNHGIFAPMSKISKLNDLNVCNWKVGSKDIYSKQTDQVQHSNWDYNVGHLPGVESSSNLYIKNSVSDPLSLRIQMKAAAPSCSEGFTCDKRHDVESQRTMSSLKSSFSSRSLSKYGYVKKSQISKSSNLSFRHENSDSRMQSNSHHFPPLKSNSEMPCRNIPSENLHGFPNPVNEYDQFRRAQVASEKISPLTSESSVNERHRYEFSKMPDSFFSTFQSQDYSDFEDEVDNDDQMSAEFDESLGILTPSQMRDLTLCSDFRSSSKEVKGTILDFPSSESFDDINELPEDEQLHDVSVQYLPEPTSTNYKTHEQIYSANRCKNLSVINECQTSQTIRKTDDFLYSISHKEINGHEKDANGPQIKNRSVSGSFDNAKEINGLSINDCSDKNLRVSPQFKAHTFDNNVKFVPECAENSISNPSGSGASFTHYASLPTKHNASADFHINTHNFVAANNKNKESVIKSCINADSTARINNTEKFAQRFNHIESENPALKEKLTVSWEDCLSHSSDNMLNSIERPESVYTAGSNDTGYQEDGDFDGDGGMTTSVESTDDAKRLSLASRDSGMVTEEIDGYKIAESNSTSGYSTGLSDSCCNDRHEDDLSSKRFTDEDVQDACDSEDAFSFQDISVSKDADAMNAEISDMTTETATGTALCNNSTSEALCQTMVEDSTLSEIHNLLLSPEKSDTSPIKDQNCVDTVSECANGDKNETNSSHETENLHQSKSSQSETHEINNSSNPQSTQESSSDNRNTKEVSKTVADDLEKRKPVPKSPKKNVMSKIKAIIESTASKTSSRAKSEEPESNSKRVSAPKKSRWDAVTSKIAASLAEEKSKPRLKREIKSRVDTNLTSSRQVMISCNSPKLDSSRTSTYGEGSMSPASVSSRDRRALLPKTNSTVDREHKSRFSKDAKSRAKSPRPGKTYVTSRSNSPVAASESSTTSASINSRSKIAHWNGSSSTLASNTPAAPIKSTPPKRVPPIIKPQTTSKTAAFRDATKRQPTEQCTPKVPPHSTKKPPLWLSKAELTQEIQRLSNLCEARTKELNRLKMETKHVSVGFDAFAALFKYMVEELHALSTPVISEDLQKTLKQLELAKQDLAYYEREVEEMKAHHCQELNDLSNKLFEVYQGEITDLSVKHQEEVNKLKFDYQKQIEDLSSSYNLSSKEAKLNHDILVAKLQHELSSQKEELQMLQEQEIRDLEEKHAQSTKVLQEHIEQLQKKCADLKQHSIGIEDAMSKDTDSKLQWVSSKKGDLEKEVESLKAVLEMKNKELHTLRVQTLEMEKHLEDLPLAREKIKMLHARAEDLEALMVEKTKLERKLSNENQQIKDTYERESKVNRRLSMENEELQWRLKQAENSLLSHSFSDVASVPEHPEDEEEEKRDTLSPDKSPGSYAVSRSVFFTFIDKDDNSSPRTPYKKITPGFSANYKTSPCRSSKSTPSCSPYRTKSHSDPPMLCSTPRKRPSSGKQKNKLPSSCSDSGRSAVDAANIRLVSSMTSSVSSESSCYEQKDILLESHEEEIRESLEILLEQRSFETAVSEPTTPIASKNMESPGFENGDMSRSAEFSDPKTYYHMTFSDAKEVGIMEYDNEESGKIQSQISNVKSIHSINLSDKDLKEESCQGLDAASGDASHQDKSSSVQPHASDIQPSHECLLNNPMMHQN